MSDWIDANERLPGWHVNKIWAVWLGEVVLLERVSDSLEWVDAHIEYPTTTYNPDAFTHWQPYAPPAPPEEGE